MEERRDYAVLRFVDQNGWSYMVNDYAKGCSLMEYITRQSIMAYFLETLDS